MRSTNARVFAWILVVAGLMLTIGCATPETSLEPPPAATQMTTPEQTSVAPPAAAGLSVSSIAFGDGSAMPARFAGTAVPDGKNVSPPVQWMGAPDGVASFALLVVDRHPIADNWIHWMAVDMPPNTAALPERASGALMPPGTRELANTYGEQGWGGPAPPAGSGAHTYEIAVYALSVPALSLPDGASLDAFEAAVKDVTLARGAMTGTFEQ